MSDKIRTWGSLKEKEVIIIKGLEKEPMTVIGVRTRDNRTTVKAMSWKQDYTCTHKSHELVTVC